MTARGAGNQISAASPQPPSGLCLQEQLLKHRPSPPATTPDKNKTPGTQRCFQPRPSLPQRESGDLCDPTLLNAPRLGVVSPQKGQTGRTQGLPRPNTPAEHPSPPYPKRPSMPPKMHTPRRCYRLKCVIPVVQGEGGEDAGVSICPPLCSSIQSLLR